tara:strand:+ start:1511 stop:1954 length:444 start_codon:yes stop_codon:yes gene_type:complete
MEDPYVVGLDHKYTPHPGNSDYLGNQVLLEWSDGNPDAEDRSGLFVSFNDENKLVIGGKNPIGIASGESHSGDPAAQWVEISPIATLVIDQQIFNQLTSIAKICSKTGTLTRKSTFTRKKHLVRILDASERHGLGMKVKVKVMWKWH